MTAKIASIYYLPLEALREKYTSVPFKLPAVPKNGSPEILVVNDYVQMEKQPYILGGGHKPVTIKGEEIAACLVKEWSENGLGQSPDCGPGIWIVRETVPVIDDLGNYVVDAAKKPQFRAATDEEKAAMFEEDHLKAIERQEKWGDYLIQEGNILASDPEGRKIRLISPAMKESAKYFGREVPWTSTLKAGDRKTCPFCAKSISPVAAVCEFCNNVVDKARYDTLKAQMKTSAA